MQSIMVNYKGPKVNVQDLVEMKPQYWLIEDYPSPVTVCDGHMFMADIDKHGVVRYKLTGGLVRERGRRGIYVVDFQNNIYMTPRCPEVPHHSDFLRGGPVLCAGMYHLDKAGRLVYVDNKSGHYGPDGSRLRYVAELLADRGYKGPVVYKDKHVSGIELINSFFSPEKNRRCKKYGGSKNVSDAGAVSAN